MKPVNAFEQKLINLFYDFSCYYAFILEPLLFMLEKPYA